MGLLKRLFGTTDALADARAEAGHEESMPAGWTSPATRDEGDAIVFEMSAPGLDPETVAVEPAGSVLHVRASGQPDSTHKISLDESLNFPEGSDVSGASATYTDDRLVIRVPKAGLKQS